MASGGGAERTGNALEAGRGLWGEGVAEGEGDGRRGRTAQFDGLLSQGNGGDALGGVGVRCALEGTGVEHAGGRAVGAGRPYWVRDGGGRCRTAARGGP